MGIELNYNARFERSGHRTRTLALQTRQEPEPKQTLITIAPEQNRTEPKQLGFFPFDNRHPTIQTAKETQP